MNYDSIIVEMLSRIQELENQVRELNARLGGEVLSEKKVTTADIRDYIEEKKSAARKGGSSELVLKANDIHKEMKLKSRFPMVCNAMRQCMGGDDEVVHASSSGYSSSLQIKYRLI